jgi:hypothetical protein
MPYRLPPEATASTTTGCSQLGQLEPSSPRRPGIFLTDTAPDRTATTVLQIERLERLDDLALPEPDDPLPGDLVTGPLQLISAHEQRDLCCGLAGRALMDAMAGPDIFATSHLGRHRFAPTALLLPTGYVYGRLEPTSALRAAAIRELQPGR